MSLIKCPECGKTVSNKATTCPMCGYPINAKQIEKHRQEIADFHAEQYQKHINQFLVFMLIGLLAGFSGFLIIISLTTAAISGMGIFFGLVSLLLLTTNPLDFYKFSIPRLIWSFCTGYTVGLILRIVFSFFN